MNACFIIMLVDFVLFVCAVYALYKVLQHSREIDEMLRRHGK